MANQDEMTHNIEHLAIASHDDATDADQGNEEVSPEMGPTVDQVLESWPSHQVFREHFDPVATYNDAAAANVLDAARRFEQVRDRGHTVFLVRGTLIRNNYGNLSTDLRDNWFDWLAWLQEMDEAHRYVAVTFDWFLTLRQWFPAFEQAFLHLYDLVENNEPPNSERIQMSLAQIHQHQKEYEEIGDHLKVCWAALRPLFRDDRPVWMQWNLSNDEDAGAGPESGNSRLRDIKTTDLE